MAKMYLSGGTRGWIKIKKILDKKQVKILSLTASPESDVFYELAQDTLMNSFSHYKNEDLFIDLPDPVEATLTEIDLRCRDTPFDILILFCHGSKEGFLLFEDRMGNKIPVPGEKVARVIAGLDHQPLVIILSACHSAAPGAKAALTFLESPGQALLKGTPVPCIIGMKREISQHAAMDFNNGFIRGLLKDQSFHRAFEAGVAAIREGEQGRLQDKGMKWHYTGEAEIPALLSRETDTPLTRKDFHDTPLSRPTIDSTDFERASYLKRGFVGRRKELREVFHAMDEEKPGVIHIKGPGGMGKSTFMTRVCSRYLRAGYTLVVFVGPVQVHRVLEKLVQKTADPGYAEAFAQQQSDSWDEVFFDLVRDILAPQKVIIFFDNFEDNQEIDTGAIPDQEVQRFISLCTTHLAGKDSVLIITGRYTVPAGVRHIINLPPLTGVENRKLFMFKQTLKNLEARRIMEVYAKIGGNPRAVEVLEVLSREAFGRQGPGDLTGTKEKQALFGRVIGEVQSILTGTTKQATFEFSPQYPETLVRTLSPEKLALLKGISLYRTPVTEGAPGIPGPDLCYGARKKLIHLSLIMFIPYNTYYSYRLVSEYVTVRLYEQEELKSLRVRAGEYLEESGDYFEAIYQYKGAGEWDRAFDVAGPLQDWLRNHGYMYEARGIMEGFDPALLDKAHQARWYHAYGMIEHRQGNVENALVCYEKAARIEEELGNKEWTAVTYHQIGMIHQDKGEYDRAIDFYTKSLHIQEELGNKAGMAASYGQIGRIYQVEEKFNEALGYFIRAYCLFRVLQNPYRQLAGKYILQLRPHIPGDEYEGKLRKAGISVEELGQAKGGAGNVVAILRQFTRLVLTGDDKAPEQIDTFIAQVPEEAKGDEQWKVIAGYLEFLKELAGAEDREGFLAGADAEMVGLMRQLSGEDVGDGESSGQEKEDTADWIQEITQMALAGDSGTAEQIDTLIAKMPEEAKGSDDWPIMKGYFRFLKELAAAGDREGFLAKADVGMIGLMEQFLGEEACEGDAPGQVKVLANDILRQLTRLVLDGVAGVTEKIDTMIAETPEEEKRSKDWLIVGGYFMFLKELAAAEDKEGFLTGADVVMVGLMRKLLREDAGDGDSSEQKKR